MKHLLVILISMIILLSCHKKVNESRITPPAVPPSTAPTIGIGTSVGLDIGKNNNLFAFEMYKTLKEEKGNIFFSPYSISMAMSMVYAGAKNNTEAEISKAMKFSLSKTSFNQSVKKHNDSLLNLKSKEADFQLANSIWAQEKYPFLDNYFNTLKEYYNSGLNYTDFEKKSEKSRIEINDWVLEQTNDKIQELIPQGSLTSDTRMVLVNAIYFLGKWQIEFDKGQTKKDKFILEDQTEKEAKFMNLYRKEFAYLQNQLLEVIEIPYSGENFSMMIFLPLIESDIYKLEKYLTLGNIENWSESLSYQKMDLTIPKFKLEYAKELSGVLGEMGITDAFTDYADFSGMTGKTDLKIDKVLHKAFVEVDEKGTEAAAATAVIMMETTSINMNKRPHFKADHPFIFIIKDNVTNTILFMGRVMDPTL